MIRTLRTLRTLRLPLPLALALVLAAAPRAHATTFSENFDNVAALVGSGWSIINNSTPGGSTNWFQGEPGIFAAQAGAPSSYVAANFNNAGVGGDISDWLLTPLLALDNTTTLKFFTRTEAGSVFPDRLEVRLSTNGASANVGATPTSVGDFTTLLLTINPALAVGGYPEGWTQFSVTLSGLGAPTTGRFGFRYFVTNNDVNADYIGIDTVTVEAVPEPATLALTLTGMAGVLARRRKTKKNANR